MSDDLDNLDAETLRGYVRTLREEGRKLREKAKDLQATIAELEAEVERLHVEACSGAAKAKEAQAEADAVRTSWAKRGDIIQEDRAKIRELEVELAGSETRAFGLSGRLQRHEAAITRVEAEAAAWPVGIDTEMAGYGKHFASLLRAALKPPATPPEEP